MIKKSSDPRLLLNLWRMASEVLLSTNVSVSMSTVRFRVNKHFFVGHVSCLRNLTAILKNKILDILCFLQQIKECGPTAKLLHKTNANNLI